jgi:hypothetical protein
MPRLEFDLIAAPAAVFGQIADLSNQRLSGAVTPSDHKFDVPLSAKSRWTFHLHVRD